MRTEYFRHMTLNTGHAANQYRADVSDEAVAHCATLIGEAGSITPIGWVERYDAEIVDVTERRLFHAVNGPSGRVMLSMVCTRSRNSIAAWGRITDVARDNRIPHENMRAPDAPWIGDLIMRADPSIEWLADYSRCMAWAFFERSQAGGERGN